MNLLDRVSQEPELRDDPPVLIDVGAAGGVPRAWQRIARYSIGIAFDGDDRETAVLSDAHKLFRKWIFIPGLAAPTDPTDGTLRFHLTRSPQCSSVLPPNASGLSPWAFADLFTVVGETHVAATTLETALAAHGIGRIDWLKCDSQGLDLSIFLSLPKTWRDRVLLAEFEPGLLNAYEGEDKLADVLRVMEDEPFWVARFDVQRTTRGSAAMLRESLGEGGARRYTKWGARAPGWANITYLRDFEKDGTTIDRRAHLLGWVLASIAGQPAAALAIARSGAQQSGGAIFDAMIAASIAAMRRSMWRGILRAIVRRLRR
jgi:Methyltransferase FkbM domain